MKITKNWLKKTGACEPAVNWYNSKACKTDEELFEALIKEEKFAWTNWALVRLMNRKQKLQYAIYAAELVLPIFEKQYPEDKRPCEAIEATKAVLKRDTKINREKANAAADAAYVATNAAAYAANANANANAAYLNIVKFGLKLIGV